MVEVNEEVTRAYFEEVCGFMVRTGFYYKKSKEKRSGKSKGGAGPADIDLLIWHPNPEHNKYRKYVERYGRRAMVSVKGWHQLPKSSRSLENAQKAIDDACRSLFGDPQASNKVKEYFGSSNFKRLLVISRLDEKQKNEQKDYARQHYKVDEIIEFNEMLPDLLTVIGERNYFPESEVLQTIYLLHKYGLTKSSEY